MVELSSGGSVAVTVGGQPLQEYQVVEQTKDNVTTYTCYIEAKEGDEYKVEVKKLPMDEKSKCVTKVYVDGKFVDSSSWCTRKEKEHFRDTYTGFRTTRGGGERVCRAFLFSEMKVTNQRRPEDVTTQEIEDSSNIRVEVECLKRKGKLDHRSPVAQSETLPGNTVMPKGSKPAMIGLSTGLGQTCVEKPRRACFCETADASTGQKAIIIFKYCPHEWLVGRRIKDGGQFEDDEPQSSIRSSPASPPTPRRRSREDEAGESAQERRIRIKRELQDQLEAVEAEIELHGKVKMEEEEQKKLTAECMRKIDGRVIVIKDD